MIQRAQLPSALILTGLLTSVGCMGGVQLQVLSSAPVTVPPSVRKVAVIDRSAPRNAGQGFLDALEGALTGEDIRADRDGAEAARKSVEIALQNSPRFQVVPARFSRREVDSRPDNQPASWEVITRICKKAGCDGVVSLELFDSNSGAIEFPAVPAAADDSARNLRGSRDGQVIVTVRFYDARSRQIVDEMVRRRISKTFTNEAATVQEIRANLSNVRNQIIELGHEIGAAYGKRVAPSYAWVSRSYYVKGHPALKQAKRHVRASDWPGAVRLWAQLAGEAVDPRLKGKAHFNLALASERTGDLIHAIELAKKASVELANSRARNYLRALHRRAADAARLDAQMGAAGPPAPPPPGPQPVQPTQPAGHGPL